MYAGVAPSTIRTAGILATPQSFPIISLPGPIPGKKLQDPGYRAEVAELVDAVGREDGCVVQFLFPDTDPA